MEPTKDPSKVIRLFVKRKPKAGVMLGGTFAEVAASVTLVDGNIKGEIMAVADTIIEHEGPSKYLRDRLRNMVLDQIGNILRGRKALDWTAMRMYERMTGQGRILESDITDNYGFVPTCPSEGWTALDDEEETRSISGKDPEDKDRLREPICYGQ